MSGKWGISHFNPRNQRKPVTIQTTRLLIPCSGCPFFLKRSEGGRETHDDLIEIKRKPLWLLHLRRGSSGPFLRSMHVWIILFGCGVSRLAMVAGVRVDDRPKEHGSRGKRRVFGENRGGNGMRTNENALARTTRQTRLRRWQTRGDSTRLLTRA